MSDPFDSDFYEEELASEEDWVEISDTQGHTAAMRHLATVHLGKQTYHVLGASRQLEDRVEKALMLVREDLTADGASQYVIASEESEIERVVAHCVAHVIKAQAQDDWGAMESMDTFGDMDEMEAMETLDDIESCGRMHRVGEFCYCDDPNYLQ